MRTIKCCSASHDVRTMVITDGGSLADRMKQLPGWSFCWDTDDGLSMVYMCPDCTGVVRPLLLAVQLRLGLDITRLNFLPLLKEPK